MQPSRWILLLAPLPALLVGMWVMSRAGVAPALLALQGVAAVVGLLAALFLSRARSFSGWLAVAGLALAAVSLLAPGADGVHRWVPLGPVRLHVSSLAAPAVLLGAGAWLRAGRAGLAIAALLGLQAVHVLQPDAGQATAFGAAAIALVVAQAWTRRREVAAAAVLGLAIGIVVAWTRPDPLAPVPHVERIVQLAAGQSAALGIAAVLALALFPLALLRAAAPLGDGRAVRGALALYAIGIVLAPLLGPFPVPVMGFGVSPVLGAWMIVGAAAALGRATSPIDRSR